MKTYIITLMICFSSAFFAQKIEGKITYIASTKKALDYRNNNNGDGNLKIKNDVNEIYKKAKDVEVILNFNEKLSEYYVVDKLEVGNVENINITHIMAGSEKKYYTSNSFSGYVSNTLDCYILGECFLIENTLPKWELLQDTKDIGGFLCYRAILKNPKTGKPNLEAWYTPTIPYQYGVVDYYGLPGIILEINKNTFSIIAIKIELNPKEKIKIDEPKKVEKLTQKQFRTMTRKALPDFYKKN
jgi:GLPGLI family protein